MPTHVLWFRNDLRLHDHVALHEAARSTDFLVPIFVLDPRQFAATTLGFPKTGAFRTRFLLESLHDLRARLRAVGSELLLRVGYPEDVIPELVGQTAAAAVFASEEVTSEERTVDEALQTRLGAVPLRQFWRYDERGDYVRHWLPELTGLPTDRLQQVGLLTAAEQRQYGVRLGADYPPPLTDPACWQRGGHFSRK